jgi:hypothetical protein
LPSWQARPLLGADWAPVKIDQEEEQCGGNPSRNLRASAKGRTVPGSPARTCGYADVIAGLDTGFGDQPFGNRCSTSF